MSALPDTTEAVAEALWRKGGWSEEHGRGSLIPYVDDAMVAIAADRKALADAGYEIAKRDEIPVFVQRVPNGSVVLDVDHLAALLRVGSMYLQALEEDPDNEYLTLPEAMAFTAVRDAVAAGDALLLATEEQQP